MAAATRLRLLRLHELAPLLEVDERALGVFPGYQRSSRAPLARRIARRCIRRRVRSARSRALFTPRGSRAEPCAKSHCQAEKKKKSLAGATSDAAAPASDARAARRTRVSRRCSPRSTAAPQRARCSTTRAALDKAELGAVFTQLLSIDASISQVAGASASPPLLRAHHARQRCNRAADDLGRLTHDESDPAVAEEVLRIVGNAARYTLAPTRATRLAADALGALLAPLAAAMPATLGAAGRNTRRRSC